MTRMEERFVLIAQACDNPAFREGVLAAYRELGAHDRIKAMVEDLEWLDRFDASGFMPPSINRSSVLPTVRIAPDASLLDLMRPLVDKDGREWHWVGYSRTGRPLVSRHASGDVVVEIGEAYNATGPFTQTVPVEPEAFAVAVSGS